MNRLVFLARITILCNIVFLVTYLLHFVPALENGIVTSTILILGNILAIVFNILFHLFCLIALMLSKWKTLPVPAWMMVINFLFLVLQIILLIK